MKLCFIDTETGGRNPRIHSLLSVGLCIVDVSKITINEVGGDNPLLDAAEWYIEQRPFVVTREALRINQIDLRGEPSNLHTREHAARSICAYLSRYFDPTEKIMLAGWNPGFDARFLRQLYPADGDVHDLRQIDVTSPVRQWPFHHRVMDVQSLATATLLRGDVSPLPKPPLPVSSGDAFDYWGIVNPAQHTALADVIATALLFVRLLQGRSP